MRLPTVGPSVTSYRSMTALKRVHSKTCAVQSHRHSYVYARASANIVHIMHETKQAADLPKISAAERRKLFSPCMFYPPHDHAMSPCYKNTGKIGEDIEHGQAAAGTPTTSKKTANEVQLFGPGGTTTPDCATPPLSAKHADNKELEVEEL